MGGSLKSEVRLNGRDREWVWVHKRWSVMVPSLPCGLRSDANSFITVVWLLSWGETVFNTSTQRIDGNSVDH
jgi:hypothetical protein